MVKIIELTKLTTLVQQPEVLRVQIGVIFCDIFHIYCIFMINNSGVGTMKIVSALFRRGKFIMNKYP